LISPMEAYMKASDKGEFQKLITEDMVLD